MKIVSKGNTISTPEFRTKKMKARRKRTTLLGGAAALILVGIIALLHLESLRIHTVTVTGAAATGAETIETLVREKIAGSYLWLFPKNSTFLYPHGAIEAEILTTFPRLSVATVSLDGFSALRVEVTERQPFALSCAETCAFLDESGFIFDEAPMFSDGVYFIYRDKRSEPARLGAPLLPPDVFKNVAAFVRKIANLNIMPVSLTVGENYNELLLAAGGVLVWRGEADVAGVYADLAAFLGSEAIRAEKDFWSRVAQVDLRTPNKVFYTFKEREE